MSAEITSAEIAALRMSRSRRMFSHTRWLVGASVMAMVFGSSSALAKPLVGPGSGTSAVTAAINAANQGQQQAQQIAQQSQNALSRTVQALQAMRAAQAAAHSVALGTQSTVPNGIASGGLMPVANPLPAAQDTTGLRTWDGASLPTQSVDATGRVNVNIRQTQSSAILSWQSFNIGSNTSLTFDQQGNASWVALNRVVGNASPSQILGSIKADGTVLVINQNGIVFAAAPRSTSIRSLPQRSTSVGPSM